MFYMADTYHRVCQNCPNIGLLLSLNDNSSGRIMVNVYRVAHISKMPERIKLSNLRNFDTLQRHFIPKCICYHFQDETEFF